MLSNSRSAISLTGCQWLERIVIFIQHKRARTGWPWAIINTDCGVCCCLYALIVYCACSRSNIYPHHHYHPLYITSMRMLERERERYCAVVELPPWIAPLRFGSQDVCVLFLLFGESTKVKRHTPLSTFGIHVISSHLAALLWPPIFALQFRCVLRNCNFRISFGQTNRQSSYRVPIPVLCAAPLASWTWARWAYTLPLCCENKSISISALHSLVIWTFKIYQFRYIFV